jgi:hypothetical protein
MNRRARLGAGALLTACLLAAAPPARAQQPHARVPFEGSHAFRNILHAQGLRPLASVLELAEKDPREAVLIVLGSPSALDEIRWHLGGLARFRDAGGAILVATDRPDGGRLGELGVAVSGRPVQVVPALRNDPQRAFRENEKCPVLYGLKNILHPLFKDLGRGLATNRPSYLRLLRSRRLLPLVRFPEGCVAVPDDSPPTGLTFIAAPGAGSADRVLVLAGHGVFTNGMMALGEDNYGFAWNCVSWLREEGRRKYALLVEDGRVVGSFDVPLMQLPLPPLRAISGILRGLEEENFFNKLVTDNVPKERLLRYLFLGGSGLLLLIALARLVRAHHHGETAAPNVAAKVEKAAASDLPLVARRRAAALEAGNFYEAARDLARLCFEGEHGEPPAAPPAVVGGGRRLRRDIARLWRLAYGATPVPVSSAEFAALTALAAHVRGVLEGGMAKGKS